MTNSIDNDDTPLIEIEQRAEKLVAEFLEWGEKQEYWDRCLLTHLGEIVERELANRREEDDEFAYDDEDDEDDEGRGRNAGPGSPKLA